ncbi:MAG: ABC transporter ATP-binding protein [Candidatus Hodarchaeales archaeon]|jgi:ATP-binding cassette subfamily B protein
MVSETTKWIYHEMVSLKKLLFLTITFTLLFSSLGLFTPFFTGFAIDAIEKGLSENIPSSRLNEIFYYSFLIFLFTIFSYLFGVMAWYAGELYSAKLTQNLRSKVFKTLQGQSHKYFDQNSTGDLLSKATTDIMALWDFFWVIPYFGLSGLWVLLITILLLFYIDFQLGFISLLFFPIILFISKRFGTNYNPVVYKSRQQFGQLSKVLQENIEGAAVSRAFGVKTKEVERFNVENVQYRDIMFSVRKMQSLFTPQMKFLTGSMGALILIVGSFRVLEGNMTIGMLIASILLTTMLVRPMDQITSLFIDSGVGYGASKRVMEILKSTPEISSNIDSIIPDSLNGDISFDKVSFSYRDEPVLNDINLEIKSGTSIVFLGATGSGKSSMINLIPRYYDTIKGKVLIDQIDVKHIRLESLRKNIGFVDQETFLFSKSVHDNIAFGWPNATKEDVIKVAKIAQAHSFIKALPNKYDTLIGERGVNLSGGQRQRISIARALLADPKIVILDDSLSSVDTKTEKEIRKATEALLKDRTTIIVTQRLSSITSADKIIVLQNGQIVEEGTHLDLLKLKGFYKKLVDTQQDGLLDLTILLKTDKSEEGE